MKHKIKKSLFLLSAVVMAVNAQAATCSFSIAGGSTIKKTNFTAGGYADRHGPEVKEIIDGRYVVTISEASPANYANSVLSVSIKGTDGQFVASANVTAGQNTPELNVHQTVVGLNGDLIQWSCYISD